MTSAIIVDSLSVWFGLALSLTRFESPPDSVFKLNDRIIKQWFDVVRRGWLRWWLLRANNTSSHASTWLSERKWLSRDSAGWWYATRDFTKPLSQSLLMDKPITLSSAQTQDDNAESIYKTSNSSKNLKLNSSSVYATQDYCTAHILGTRPSKSSDSPHRNKNYYQATKTDWSNSHPSRRCHNYVVATLVLDSSSAHKTISREL